MDRNIIIKEDSIEAAVKVNQTIVEFHPPYDQAHFENRYAGKEKLILVAYVDGQSAGYLIAYNRNNDGSIYCWMAGVDPNFRRLGILNRLMEHLNDWGKAHGYQKIAIKTRNNRREMLAYLVKAGFRFIEVQPKPSAEDNRVLLEKDIA